MLPYLLLTLIFCSSVQLNIYAFEPSCTYCKHFLKSNINPELGCCKMFKNFSYNSKGTLKHIYEYSMYCRNNENMCGNSGFLYEEINNNEEPINEDINNDVKVNSDNIVKENDGFNEKQLSESYEELNNRCCGEVNEQYEIEELERDFFDLFQKIKRFNTKRIYKTTKDLYKLFKRK